MWAPERKSVEISLAPSPDSTSVPAKFIPMDRDASGYFRAVVDGIEPGGEIWVGIPPEAIVGLGADGVAGA